MCHKNTTVKFKYGSCQTKWFNPANWVAVVTPTESPKSAHNLRVIEVFGGVFVFYSSLR